MKTKRMLMILAATMTFLPETSPAAPILEVNSVAAPYTANGLFNDNTISVGLDLVDDNATFRKWLTVDYSSSLNANNQFVFYLIFWKGVLSADGTASTGSYTVGKAFHVDVVLNGSSSTQTYGRGGTESLPPRTYDVWLNGVRVIDNAPKRGNAVNGNFTYLNLRTEVQAWTIDKLVVDSDLVFWAPPAGTVISIR